MDYKWEQYNDERVRAMKPGTDYGATIGPEGRTGNGVGRSRKHGQITYQP
jgi:hypothetical protein